MKVWGKEFTVPIFNRKKRIIINRENLIAEITARLHRVSTEDIFDASNRILGTRLSRKDHVLVSKF